MATRALEIVLERLPAPVYVYHQIVHNRWVVDHFEARGACFVDDIAQVPRGSTLVLSAHGVAPDVRRQARRRDLRTIDATCPLVAKVHTEVLRFASLDYQIVLIGHAGHDEVVGTLGEAPERIHVVADEDDVERLHFDAGTKLAYLTQTTLSVDETRRVVAALCHRFPQIEGPPSDDICYATQNRQQTVRELSRHADVLIVVGSHNSSNSHRLREVGLTCGVTAHLVDDASRLEADWFAPNQTVVVTAGASAPESSVQSVVTWLQANYVAELVEYGQPEMARRFSLPCELMQLEAEWP